MDTNSQRGLIANLQSFRTMVPGGVQFSITNTQQVFPLAEIALEAHALGDLKRRDDSSLDLLAGLSSCFVRSPVFVAGFGSVPRAPDLFILLAFSSGDFFLTLSHRFLKLSDLLA
jgi:hypothetical protein